MAILVTCPTCGGAMSSNALTCPHCGETEFTECVYKNLKCEYCNGNKVISRTNTIYNVHQEDAKFYHTSLTAKITKKSYHVSPGKLEWEMTEAEKRKYEEERNILTKLQEQGKVKFIPLGETWADQLVGKVEYVIEQTCPYCEGRGYKEVFCGRRDIRKPR